MLCNSVYLTMHVYILYLQWHLAAVDHLRTCDKESLITMLQCQGKQNELSWGICKSQNHWPG